MAKTERRLKQVLFSGLALSTVGCLVLVLSFGIVTKSYKTKFVLNHSLPYWAGLPLIFTGAVGVIGGRLEMTRLISLYGVGCVACSCVTQLVAITTAISFSQILDAMVTVFVPIALVILAEAASIVAVYGLVTCCKITLMKKKGQEVVITSVEPPESLHSTFHNGIQNPCLFQELDIARLGQQEIPPDYSVAVRDPGVMSTSLRDTHEHAGDNRVPDPNPAFSVQSLSRAISRDHTNDNDFTDAQMLSNLERLNQQNYVLSGEVESHAPVGHQAGGNTHPLPVCPVYSVEFVGSCFHSEERVGGCLAAHYQPNGNTRGPPPPYPGHTQQ